MSDSFQAIYEGVRSRITGCDAREAIREAISPHFDFANYAIRCVQQELEGAASDMRQPHVLMRPKIYLDGDQWCALYGESLQDGVAGFGKSPEQAMIAFDVAWRKEQP